MADTDFAVVIGIARYPGLRSLQGPIEDAKAFIAWLEGPAQVPHDHIKPVFNKEPPDPGDNPIQREVDDAFKETWAAARKQQLANTPPRRLYIYFAGHGCSQGSRHIALLLGNATLEYLNESLDSTSYHEGLVNQALFPEQVLFYDCCRNYDARAVGRGSPWSNLPPNPAAATVKQLVLYAAGFTEYANERAIQFSERRGLFTVALLEALNGGGTKWVGGKPVITADAVELYIQRRLDELAQPLGLRQHPTPNVLGIIGDFVLTDAANPVLFPIDVTVHLPAEEIPGKELTVYDDHFCLLKRIPLAGTQAHVDLPARNYIFAVEPGGPRQVITVGPGLAQQRDL